MQLKIGTILQDGRYCIVKTLGNGGFGITYLAKHAMTDRMVCIKEFLPKRFLARDDNSSAVRALSKEFVHECNRFKAKFIKEAKTIANLDHPNIIHIYDAFEENGTAYYVMEYVDGESLSDIVKRGGALDEADALRYIREAASALEYIHDRNINHLDVKPGNIMVRREDNRAILIDFGLSKHYDAESGDATSTTPVGVSHGFAPMEQYKQGGVSKFSPETDIYSLGATLYYLVTGSVPPSATDVGEEGLPALPKHLSSSLCRTIEKSMSYWRKDRPQSINNFLALLDGAVTQASGVIVTPIIDGEAARISLGDERTVFAPTRTYKVGDYYNVNGKKGVVFEVWDGGRHGKIVSLDEAVLGWCTIEQDKKGIKLGLTNKSDGKVNTDNVMQRSDSDQYLAFVWCRNKGADWYLPAVEELEAIFNNKSKINSTLAEYRSKLSGAWYWSSTEYEDYPKFCAWSVSVDNGYTFDYGKSNRDYVRAVSAF